MSPVPPLPMDTVLPRIYGLVELAQEAKKNYQEAMRWRVTDIRKIEVLDAHLECLKELFELYQQNHRLSAYESVRLNRLGIWIIQANRDVQAYLAFKYLELPSKGKMQ